MRYCWRCGLLFDVEPVEIGRSEIDPNICIICEENLGEKTMDILTTMKFSNTGPRRLCPHCKRSISTTHHKFDRHNVPGSDGIICSGSGTAV